MRGDQKQSDVLNILSGTTQNVIGIAVAAVATFATNILISRTLGQTAFGVVTVMTQAAFVVSFATRAGMDMAVLRDVAIEVGQQRYSMIRTPVARAVAIGALVSGIAATAVILAASAVRSLFSIEGDVARNSVATIRANAASRLAGLEVAPPDSAGR